MPNNEIVSLPQITWKSGLNQLPRPQPTPRYQGFFAYLGRSRNRKIMYIYIYIYIYIKLGLARFILLKVFWTDTDLWSQAS